MANSTLGTGSTLRVGEIAQSLLQIGGGGTLALARTPALANLNLDSLGGSTVQFEAPVTIDALSISAGGAVFNAGLTVSGDLPISNATITVNGDLTIGGDLNVSASGTLTVTGLLSATNIVANGATLISDTVIATNNASLLNAATLTVADATSSPQVLHALTLDVGGTLTIDATSFIDLNLKGYPNNNFSGPDFSNNTRPSCHGGNRSNATSDCTYGRHEHIGPAGGLVIVATPDGLTGIEIAPNDLPPAEWGCFGTLIVGASTTSGLDNTNLINNQCPSRPIASSLAAGFDINGVSGWFLPSLTEFQQVIFALDAFPFTSSAGFLQPLTGGFYWTSSQLSAEFAIMVALDARPHATDDDHSSVLEHAQIASFLKNQFAVSRPIRAFAAGM